MITINIAGDDEGDGIIIISNGTAKSDNDYYGPEIGRDEKRREIEDRDRSQERPLDLPLEEHRIEPEKEKAPPPQITPITPEEKPKPPKPSA